MLVGGLVVTGCSRGRHAAPLPPGTLLVQDFERSPSIASWPKDTPSPAGVSAEWAADGIRSLKLAPGVMAAFADLYERNWTGYSVLRFRVHNPGTKTEALGVEVQDQHEAFNERHQRALGVAPGDHDVALDFSGGLWRGEENRPYRGRIKTPIDVAHVSRLAFTNNGDGPLFVDRLVIEKVPPLVTPFGFAFDFGPSGKQVMGQTLGVFETTAYAPDRGYGMIGGPPSRAAYAMSYPTPLLGDGLAFDRGGFRVDLPGGAYEGWIAFERGGFWEGEQSGYSRADLRVNGTVVSGHDFSKNAPHFLFQDTEVTDLSQIEDRLVRPSHAFSRFRFEAIAGGNVFTLAVRDAVGPPLRVAGLFLAPATSEGTAFLAAHEQRQREALRVSYPPQDRGRRGEPRVTPASDLVAVPLAAGADVFPRDLPEHATTPKEVAITAVAGQIATLHLGLYALRTMEIHVEATFLAGPEGATMPKPRLSHGRYLPTRPIGGGPVWLSVHHYLPDPNFAVGPDLTRSVIAEWRIPRTMPPGSYGGLITFTGGGLRVIVPVRLSVAALDLPAIPIPVGLFMNALPFGPEVVGDARYWELQEVLLEEQARAGLTCVTGGPGLAFSVGKAGAHVVLTGTAALRYLDLAHGQSIDRAAVGYGGFFSRLTPDWVDASAFAKAWIAFATDRRIPPFFFYAYDEPGTPRELDAAIAATTPFTRAGLATMGFLTAHPHDPTFDRLVNTTYAPALNGHGEGDLRDLARRGKHPWVYNNGMDRYGMGLHLLRNLRAGAEGRLEWIGLITQGFAFNELDGREPSTGAWVVHEKFGVLETPRWLAAREGLLDVRVRLALEKAVPPADPALQIWPQAGYGIDRDAWPDDALASARSAMIDRVQHETALRSGPRP